MAGLLIVPSYSMHDHAGYVLSARALNWPTCRLKIYEWRLGLKLLKILHNSLVYTSHVCHPFIRLSPNPLAAVKKLMTNLCLFASYC